MILLNPGPANTTASVKQAQVVPDICPREAAFGELLEGVVKQLAHLVDPSGQFIAVLFGGSGTAGVEAALASAVPENGRLLILDNGAYGRRMANIADAYCMPHDVLEFGVGAWPDLSIVERQLRTRSYSQVAVVHHETTTGMLNPVEAIAEITRRQDVELIVDAMSSYAGLDYTMDSLGADILISSSNKCVQGMAGLSFVICRRTRAESMVSVPGRSLYLNVGEQYRFFAKHRQMRFTPPVQTVYALAQALRELDDEGGIPARSARYRSCWEILDAGMQSLGFRRLLPHSQLSRILTAYLEPTHPDYSYKAMHDALFTRGFTIYPGKGATVATFRLANMGAIVPADMEAFVSALGETIAHQNWRPMYL